MRNLSWVSWVANERIPVSRTQVNEQTQQTYVYNRSYFFCSGTSAGTEGIKDVKNFVALLAPYRAIFDYICHKQVV